MKDEYKSALNICKDATEGEKNACEAAYKMVICFANNNSKFTFVWLMIMATKMIHFGCTGANRFSLEINLESI